MNGLLEETVRRFHKFEVRYILIGGWAASLHGSMRSTVDIDFVYCRSDDNIRRLVHCLADTQPYLRGAPPGLPFRFDEPTIRAGLNFTLTASIGDIDLLGEVAGGGEYDQLLPFTETFSVFGMAIRCVTLERLIQLKRAAGRPKDFEAVAELVALLEERGKLKGT